MRKATLYLPDYLKAAVQRLAVETGRTESAIMREGIALAISQHTSPSPTIPIDVSDDPHFAELADDYLAGFGEQ
jgi:hypothetical protein